MYLFKLSLGTLFFFKLTDLDKAYTEKMYKKPLIAFLKFELSLLYSLLVIINIASLLQLCTL